MLLKNKYTNKAKKCVITKSEALVKDLHIRKHLLTVVEQPLKYSSLVYKQNFMFFSESVSIYT